MRLTSICLLIAVALGACAPKKEIKGTNGSVAFWLTTGDKTSLLAKQEDLPLYTGSNNAPTIEIDETQTYQSIDGFGFTLTGGSATLINALPAAEKQALIKELFSAEGNGIGSSYLRISIGASDLSTDSFTYNDLPAGETDINQDKFSIAEEQKDLIPVLKMIVAVNPSIKILGSPWSAPTWMKTNNSFKGGSLKPEFYASYAKYFIKYLAAMKAQGINIDAITIQNEPLHPGNVPSMYMEAADQAVFIKKALGPAFKSAGIKTKIILYDHNADKPEYPISILNDADARQYVDGSAFHLYGGDISALTKVHDAHPDKNLYFTEQWVGGPGNFPEDLKWHVSTLIIGATRNWSRNVLEWNLAADPAYNPHTDGGCTSCLGAITISPAISRNVAYYVIGHAAKFVTPGSVRIASNITSRLENVAFKTPQGKIILIVTNNNATAQNFNIKSKGKTVQTNLPEGAVGTYVF
ncbi:glucosylceramidase [Pedobacter sp. MC2016-14]|uniref:glycoside hydrolase family 30 protein n=1 Tax=Pedobacter sp. MC2016-14 TaxID=2897327 RepID=UPI001E29C079|nr:glycoside hydrolase family 30 beta sandwich domain-containing protein [Pedobacter sp. MC2016-14]MCD0488219.1 glucosylceramidase [Pedobacter sp. MC2016-14]